MKKEEARFCLECEKRLPKASRSDKKFCDNECRDDYFNKRKGEEGKEISMIQSVLKSNRRILKELLGKKPDVIIDKAILLKLGYNFDYHTHHVISKSQGNEFIFSFNYGYRVMPDNRYKIVKSFR